MSDNAPAMRYFIDGWEVTETDAREAERLGTAYVAKGGSGVVPEDMRQPGETADEYLRPWLAMISTHPIPPEDKDATHSLFDDFGGHYSVLVDGVEVARFAPSAEWSDYWATVAGRSGWAYRWSPNTRVIAERANDE